MQQINPGRDQVGITWLGQAGFMFRSPSGQVVLVDPYLSDACERQFGFRRQVASPVEPHALSADWLVCTHNHLDHQDPDLGPYEALGSPMESKNRESDG